MKRRSYSYKEYLRAMELLKDHGPTDVCRILGWPMTRKSTLPRWKSGKHKPPAAKWHPKPSKELAPIFPPYLSILIPKTSTKTYIIKTVYSAGSGIRTHAASRPVA